MDRDRALTELLEREQIRELATRYSIAVDSHDVDTLALLFDEDVEHGKAGKGPAAAKEYFGQYLESGPTATMHLVANHQIDFVDDDNATGVCYYRVVSGTDGVWSDRLLVYFDTYRRRDGHWHFLRRRISPMVRLPAVQPPPDEPFRIPDAWDRYRQT